MAVKKNEPVVEIREIIKTEYVVDDKLKNDLQRAWTGVNNYSECLSISMAGIFEENGVVDMTTLYKKFKNTTINVGVFDEMFTLLWHNNRGFYDGKKFVCNENLYKSTEEMKNK